MRFSVILKQFTLLLQMSAVMSTLKYVNSSWTLRCVGMMKKKKRKNKYVLEEETKKKRENFLQLRASWINSTFRQNSITVMKTNCACVLPAKKLSLSTFSVKPYWCIGSWNPRPYWVYSKRSCIPFHVVPRWCSQGQCERERERGSSVTLYELNTLDSYQKILHTWTKHVRAW